MFLIAVYAPLEMCELKKRCPIPNNPILGQRTLWTNLLFFGSFNLLLALRELAASYVLIAMVLVPGTSTPLF